MKAQPTKQEVAREISEECRAIYEEICNLQKHFGWTQKHLCEKVIGPVICDDAGIFGGKEEEEILRKLSGQVKKMFQRKAWVHNKATGKTLAQLTQLRSVIYRTDAYRYSDRYESGLPLELRKAIAQKSKKLDQRLLENDSEE